MREISHSEASTMLDCQMKHAFAYTGALTGGTALEPKVPHLRLREGRAWGRAVAAWHETGDVGAAIEAAHESVYADEQEIRAIGGDPADAGDVTALVFDLIEHYAATTPRLPGFHGQETEVVAEFTALDGRRFGYRCYFDGLSRDEHGRLWLVEFKLRGKLTTYGAAVLGRQLRWYAWAYRERTGEEIAGAILDERLRELPKPVKINKDGTPSKRQSCTPQEYTDACERAGVTPDYEVLGKLAAKQWSVRHEIVFMPGELDEVARQMRTVATMVDALDHGRMYPVRNPSGARCNGCAFLDICGAPHDAQLIDTLFRRVPPKWTRNREEAA